MVFKHYEDEWLDEDEGRMYCGKSFLGDWVEKNIEWKLSALLGGKPRLMTTSEAWKVNDLAVESGEKLLFDVQTSAIQTRALVETAKFIKNRGYKNVFSIPDFNTWISYFAEVKSVCCTSPTMYGKIDWLVDRSKLDLVKIIRDYDVDVLVLSLFEEQQKIPLLQKKVKSRCVYRNKEFVVYEVKA